MLTIALSAIGVGLGLIIGFLAGVAPIALLAVPMLVAVSFVMLRHFEYSVIMLLVLRSAIDSFSEQQLTVAFALGVDALAIAVVILRLLSRQKIHLDRMWIFFALWCAVQGIWVVLLPLGGLGMGGWMLSDGLREWVRIFSWLMAYLLVMQLKGKVPPKTVITLLFWSLLVPLLVAVLQMTVPSILPPEFSIHGVGAEAAGPVEDELRVRGSLGHPNGLATMLFFFLGLTYWKWQSATQPKWPWLLLLGILSGFYVTTKALFSLVMITVFMAIVVARRLSLGSLLGGGLIVALILTLFGSTEFGQERLASIGSTPLLNPDIDITRAILMSNWDYNSFNWRLSQWYLLWQRWEEYPWLGYGLGLSLQTAGNGFLPHNDYIRAMIEGGLIGLGTYLMFFVGQMLHLFRLFQTTTGDQRQLCFILFAMVPAILMGMLTENIWSHTMLYFYWWTAVAVAGWDWDERSQTPEIEPQLKPSIIDSVI
ncbi:MAG: O-antigen ligase family protein [Synechococcales cyanobacterium RM1_1_8]|nr:O-antigen ligase family protein [Synechococcales cyanobacterium RM1_1_8]